MKKMEKKVNELISKVSVVTQKTEELNNSIILIKNYIECQQRISSAHVIPTQHVMTPPDAVTPPYPVIPTQHVMTASPTPPPVMSRYNR
jgi:hypothetical protein